MAKVGFVIDGFSLDNGLQIIYENVSKHFNAAVYNYKTPGEYEIIVTDVPHMIPELPGKVFFVSTDQDGGILNPDPAFRSTIANYLNRAIEVFAYSQVAANRLEELYGVKCIVDTPHISDGGASSEEFILYYNLPQEVFNEFPHEKFIPFETPQQLKRAKLYLHKPTTTEYYNLRMLFASAYGVPTIIEDGAIAQEFKSDGDTLISAGADTKKWIQTIRQNMRDRHINSRKAREGINRYNHSSELINKIRQNVVDAKTSDLPKHADMLRNLKYEEKIQKMQARQAVNRRGGYKAPPTAEQARKLVVSREERRRGYSAPIPTSSIFLTGGIGDVMALESHFTDEMRASLETIYYATHKWPMLKELFSALPNYPKLTKHIVVWDDFKHFWCFIYKEECVQHLNSLGQKAEDGFYTAPDFGIIPIFSRINAGKFQYTDSSFVTHRLCPIDKFELPAEYIAICPYSNDKRIASRDFNGADWDAVIKYLVGRGIKGVVLNNSSEPVPESNQLINLANKTNITEAVEVVKNACGYVGIDSAMSVVASKNFSPDNMVVKTHNSHLHNYKHIYYAPMKDFSFLGNPSDKLSEPRKFKNLGGTREITISTVQGLGDIFWVYQKVAPYFDRIHLQILIVDDSPVQKRADEWVRLFPKVGVVSFRLVQPMQYHILAKAKFPLHSIIDQWRKGIDNIPYSVNAFLESGTRIDEIDGGSSVDIGINLPTEHVDVPFPEYLCLYVSGAMKQLNHHTLGAWNIDSWVELIEKMYARYNKRLPVVLVGANFDIEAIEELKPRIQRRLNVDCQSYVQFKPAQVIDIIKKANVFVGFQSGLNIIADNYNVRQVMIYFNMLKDMSYTWCKKGNVKTVFHAFTFNDTTDQIVASLPDGFLDSPST